MVEPLVISKRSCYRYGLLLCFSYNVHSHFPYMCDVMYKNKKKRERERKKKKELKSSAGPHQMTGVWITCHAVLPFLCLSGEAICWRVSGWLEPVMWRKSSYWLNVENSCIEINHNESKLLCSVICCFWLNGLQLKAGCEIKAETGTKSNTNCFLTENFHRWTQHFET